jgi:GT2 family glycosyltransferase
MTEVSVVILNYKRADLTIAAVESVLGQKGVEPEVIVVDNGSADGSAQNLKDRFGGRIKLIENENNLGFSPANNQAFKIASGDWVALMNNDAVADPCWLKLSLQKTSSGKKVGAVVPKILNYFDREKLDGIGVGFWLDGISRARRRGELDSVRFNRETPRVASGCACLLNKKMLDELGGFDPSFFAYSEDTDLGIRAFLAGWQCVYEPDAVVYHRYSSTSSAKSGYSPMKLFYVERNRAWVMLRYYPLRLILVSPFTSFWRYSYQAYQVLFSKGQGPGLGAGSAMKALAKALFQALVSFPTQMKLRRKWRSSKSTARAFDQMIAENTISWKEISRLD